MRKLPLISKHCLSCGKENQGYWIMRNGREVTPEGSWLYREGRLALYKGDNTYWVTPYICGECYREKYIPESQYFLAKEDTEFCLISWLKRGHTVTELAYARILA